LAVLYLIVTHTWPRKPRIEAVSYEVWQEELSARRGSVVVVPVWASWCRECIEILPGLVDLSERYREKGVTFASLCLEEYAQTEEVEAAEHIVRAHGAKFPHFLPQQDVAASLDALALDDLPAVLVYDQAGDLKYRVTGDEWSNEISLADVQDAIDSLLSAGQMDSQSQRNRTSRARQQAVASSGSIVGGLRIGGLRIGGSSGPGIERVHNGGQRASRRRHNENSQSVSICVHPWSNLRPGLPYGSETAPGLRSSTSRTA
jgi:thiol-disulfide isomerase/thioredoxin